jgi:hypothetical protein
MAGADDAKQERAMLDTSSHMAIDETSARYDGWRIVAVCFAVATFGWGLGFYGQSVYLAELQRLHGWPAALISSGPPSSIYSAQCWWPLSARRCARSARATACWAAFSRWPRRRS